MYLGNGRLRFFLDSELAKALFTGWEKYAGGMAERSKAAVLKTVVPQGTVGSNPTPSA
jgi:hypothetical protein